MIVALCILALVVVLIRRRMVRRDVRAGLNSDRPVFSVEPPTRRLSKPSRERL